MTRGHTALRAAARTWVRWLVAAVAASAVPACNVTDVPIWRPRPPSAEAFEVEEVLDVPYYQGVDADEFRHRLDLFLPKGQKNFPVVMLVHGGAWCMGDNRCCGLYPSVGKFLASQGIGAVLPTYRQAPEVQHPEHVRDVARALAWTCCHIGEHGGRTDQIFLAGHSAGGHLVTLLATDEQYLQAEGLNSECVKGVIGISGVYRIPTGSQHLTVGGHGPLAVRFDEMAPVRGVSGPLWGCFAALPGFPMSVNVFGPAFGDDPQVRADASPINHVRPGLPPFLLFSAEKDLPFLPEMAKEFEQALRAQGGEVSWHCIDERNHNSIMFEAIDLGDPVARGIVEFVRQHSCPAKP